MEPVSLEYPGVVIHSTGTNELSGARIEQIRTEVLPISSQQRDPYGSPLLAYASGDAGMVIEYTGRIWAESLASLHNKILALERLLNTARMWEVSPVDNEDLPLRRGFFRLINGSRAYIVRGHGSPSFEFLRTEGAQFAARYVISMTSMFPAYATFIATPPGTNRIGNLNEFSGKLEVRTAPLTSGEPLTVQAGEYPSKLYVKIASGQTASARLEISSPYVQPAFFEVAFSDTGQFSTSERIIDLTTLAVYVRATSPILERLPWQLIGFLPPVPSNKRPGAAFTLGRITEVFVASLSGSATLLWMPLYVP